MSDRFADEFEKWLESSPDARHRDGTEENDSNDGSGNESECTVNTAHSGESEFESGKLQKNMSDRFGSKLISVSQSDQAPILLDDDDDDLCPSKKQQYEDEPPILEPVPRQLQNCTISNVRSSQFSPQTCMRSYSRNNQIHSRKPLPGEQKRYIKTYSNTDNVNDTVHVTHVKSCHRNSLKSRGSKRGGNIFDTFISESCEDFPPPLIPSPEALQIGSESPCSTIKHPSNSPDFCAMEADSTSEISDERVGGVFQSQRLSKNSANGEVSVECDSTCMFVASPAIVSPASVSNSDMEATRDSGEEGNKDCELENSVYKSNMYDDAFEVTNENEQQTKLMQNAMKKGLFEDLVCNKAHRVNYFGKDSVQMAEEPSCLAGLQTLDVSTLSSSNCSSLLVTVKTHGQNNESDFPEPPVLSAISPTVRPHYMLRNKRHTVDSPESFSRSRKRQHNMSSNYLESAVFDISTPPTLTHVSDTVISQNPRSRRSNVSQHSKMDCLSCQHDRNLCRRRQRCNTLPITDLTEYYSSLSVDLRNFIIGTSELSVLQTHMHRLLYQLFPQLRTELDAMSPESFKFESLLSDLIKLLEESAEQDRLTPPPILSKDKKPALINGSSAPVSVISELDNTSQNICDKSSFVSTSDPQAAADFAKHILKSDAISSNHSLLLLLSSVNVPDCHQRQTHHKKTHQCASEESDKDLEIPLSQLTVKDKEDILTPSKVLLCKNPEIMLDRFVQLSCRALQLLLPDLTVSLYTELAQSPQDLIVFINNVILTNSRIQSKH